MNWLTILSAIIAGWALLRVFGGERQRQMQDLQVSILNAAREAKAKVNASAK
jgi:hypothetical protein